MILSIYTLSLVLTELVMAIITIIVLILKFSACKGIAIQN